MGMVLSSMRDSPLAQAFWVGLMFLLLKRLTICGLRQWVSLELSSPTPLVSALVPMTSLWRSTSIWTEESGTTNWLEKAMEQMWATQKSKKLSEEWFLDNHFAAMALKC